MTNVYKRTWIPQNDLISEQTFLLTILSRKILNKYTIVKEAEEEILFYFFLKTV